jgi:hypothetical protein
MNPNDIFWLASYAHRQLTPLMAPLDANLKLNLNFGGSHPGLDIWLHSNSGEPDDSMKLPYKLVANTKEQVDQFAAKVKALASVPA